MRIGVFDSGYGGLTILRALQCELPDYDFVYLGDNARAPYGPRSFDVVYEYTLQAVKCLQSKDCDLIVLACNTASAKALRSIQQNDLPHLGADKRVLGVIRPTVEVIDKFSVSRKVGIFATEGTVASRSYSIEIHKLTPDIQVFEQACPLLVPLIENNEWQSPGADYFIRKYADVLMRQCSDIDTVVLGCTHYPLIKSQIESVLPAGVRVVEQGMIVAESLKDYLHRHPKMDSRCQRNGVTEYLTTESEDKFRKAALSFIGLDIHPKKIIL